jgi:hypothetical protein
MSEAASVATVTDEPDDELMKALDALPALMKLKDAAAFLEVSTKTLRRWRLQGLLDTVEVGGSKRITKASVIRLLTTRPAGS